MRVLVFGVLIYSAFALIFSFLDISYMAQPDVVTIFLAAEFFAATILYAILLNRTFELNSSRTIFITLTIGWLITSSLLTFKVWYSRPPAYTEGFTWRAFFQPQSMLIGLVHSVVFGIGAFMGSKIATGVGERLLRKVSFAIHRSEEEYVDLLVLADNLREEPERVKAGVLHLIMEGYVTGDYDEVSNRLYLGPRSITTEFIQKTKE